MLVDGVIETVKHEIKKTRERISWFVVRNFKCINVRKYVNWKRSHESRKMI